MDYTELRARDGSRTWRLRYTNRGLRWFERQTGLRFTDIDPNKLGLEEATALIAAGLLHEHKDVTIEDADDLIDGVGLHQAFRGFMEAIERDLGGDLDELEPLNGTAPKNVSGAGSRRK